MLDIQIQTDQGILTLESDENLVYPETGFAPASPSVEQVAIKAQEMWAPVWAWAKDFAVLAKSSDTPPSEMEIEFAVVAKGSATFAVVSGGTEGSVHVRIKWTNSGTT